MAKPKQPAIPAVPNDVTPAMRGFLSAMREVLQVQSGQGRGDELDKAVTFRDLGLTSMGGSGASTLGKVINGLIANGEVVAQSAVERPTTPTGVSVTTYIGGIMVSWDNPRYNGHAYTEVFAQPTAVDAQNQPIDAPALNTETMLLGTAGSPLLGVQARTLLGYYVWVRHVNTLGQVGPVHAALGSYVYLPPSPSYLLEQLTNEITRDQLSIELQEPIDLVPVLETAITAEQTARANGDSANATAINTLSATVDGHTASIQTNASAIAATNSTYTAQWSTKTTVGALNGGFGIFNDGTTTRFTVHANRFAIMDTSLGNTPFIPFVVDNGKTVIADAFIRTAYIESLASGQITAAKINSLNLNAINITGGTLSLGGGDNNMSFQEGGSAGFGKGGPYGGWGYGWNTIIYNDGSLYTNRLYASNGTFTGTVNANAGTFNNVTINESCDVRGTVYANKLVGDVTAITAVANETTYTVLSSPKARTLILQFQLTLDASSPVASGMSILVNGDTVSKDTIASSSHIREFYFYTYTIAANTSITFRINVVNANYTKISGLAIVTPVTSGTFA